MENKINVQAIKIYGDKYKQKVDKGWFIPSRAEWAAFGEELKISQEKYANYDLSPYYWTSSQRNSNLVWGART